MCGGNMTARSYKFRKCRSSRPKLIKYNKEAVSPMAISLRNDASHGYYINHKSAIEMETLVETESNIIGSIREMGIGDEIEFPLSKAPYIRNAIAQRLMPERQAGCRWSTVASVEEGTIVVKRIA